ncbi:condensation domain-containing protein, partial [Methylosinus sp. Sm6]|uniref:condensation domain-containing protein n=1 Tax=Methylosinus sp. Sm6 TaxID=2866948 RepID=UPI001D91C88D
LLGVEHVSRNDDFFELGGHSMLAVQLLSRIRARLGAEAPLTALFAGPTLKDFAATLEAFGHGAPPPPMGPANRGTGPLVLSFAQQRLWFLSRFDAAASVAYHIAGGVRLCGSLDAAALRRALDRIVERHEALRTTFVLATEEPEQKIGSSETGFHLVEHDLSGAADVEDALRRLFAREASEPFDLERGPLIRGRLARLGDNDHALLMTMHHIVSDGWSMGVLTRELSALYAAFSGGSPDPLPPLPAQYADYALWQRNWLNGERLERQADYWRRMLEGAPGLLELPTDRPRPPRQDFAGASVPVRLEASLTQGLEALARSRGATLYMALLAGWASLLGRLSGQREVVIGSPTANRARLEIEPLIGFFVNTLALRIDLSGSPDMDGLLSRVKTRTLEAQDHQDLPFEQVVEIAQPVRSLAHAPLFQALFAWQNAPEGTIEAAQLRLTAIAPPRENAQFDLSLVLWAAEGEIIGELNYATALFDRETIERHIGYWTQLLEGCVKNPATPMDEIEIIPEQERKLILEGFNRT